MEQGERDSASIKYKLRYMHCKYIAGFTVCPCQSSLTLQAVIAFQK
jgi:hypothetical protein